jgi:hypothetical protein
MKKVISALTVAAMCASMSASVLPAFAIDAAKAEFYLKAVKADKGTISEDGATITFASAADAKGAKITIQEFIKADTSEPYVQQVLSGFRVVDTKSIKLGEEGVDYEAAGYGESAEYSINGTNVKTDKFVSCFATLSKTKKFQSGAKQVSWGHSNNWAFEYDGPDTLNLIWAQPNGAPFADAQTDKYPFTEFYATIGDDIVDGTYEIEILDTWENKINGSDDNPNGVQDGSSINDGTNVTKITKTKNLKIVVGNAEVTTTEAPKDTTEAPKDTTEAPKDTTEPQATTQPTKPSSGMTMDEKKAASEWTWYFDDVVYDPAADADGFGAVVTAYVTKDQGTYGYEFAPLIDGKSLAEAGFTFVEANQTDEGYSFGSFDFNEENGHLGGAASKKEDTKLADGTAVVEMNLLPPKDAKPGTVYEVSFKGLLIGNYKEEKLYPKTINGSITIKGEKDPEQTTTEPQQTTTEPQKDTTEPQQTTTEPTKPSSGMTMDEKKAASEWTWYFDDVVYDPAEDADGFGAVVTAYVTKDQGTYGYEFAPLIDGKSLAEAGFTFIEANQTDEGYSFGSFDFNEENGHLGGAASKKEDTKLADGTPVVTMNLLPPKDAKPGTVYEVSFKGLLIGNYKEEKLYPKTINGSITIKGEKDPEQTTTEPQKDTTEPQKDTTEPQKDTTEPTKPTTGDYIYGDVNEDGKVELVDVVKLNRYISGIDKEISAKATVQANCYRESAAETDDATTTKNLDGSDSVQILSYLIGLVDKLPYYAG